MNTQGINNKEITKQNRNITKNQTPIGSDKEIEMMYI